MSILWETTLGDMVMDLDVEGSPALCRNLLKLAKARYYTNTLVYNVQPGRVCQLGDPRGDGTGGASIHGLLDMNTVHNNTAEQQPSLQTKTTTDVTTSKRRFLTSTGRRVDRSTAKKGTVVAVEWGGIPDTIGSQFLICTHDAGPGRGLDGVTTSGCSLGTIVEDDDHVLEQIDALYCDKDGRPHADVRVIRALVLDDPFDDPPGYDQLLKDRGIVFSDDTNTAVIDSPRYERPPEEVVEERILWTQVDDGRADDPNQEEAMQKKEDHSRAVVLEMLGDLPSADVTAPENVLFVCQMNPETDDDDLELIFSRFGDCTAEIIRDPDTGASLHYAFVEFSNPQSCNEAYFKMNNALVDDRRIKVDFSQSVAKEWNKYSLQKRHHGRGNGRGGGRGGGRGFSGRSGGRGPVEGRRNRPDHGNRASHEDRFPRGVATSAASSTNNGRIVNGTNDPNSNTPSSRHLNNGSRRSDHHHESRPPPHGDENRDHHRQRDHRSRSPRHDDRKRTKHHRRDNTSNDNDTKDRHDSRGRRHGHHHRDKDSSSRRHRNDKGDDDSSRNRKRDHHHRARDHHDSSRRRRHRSRSRS